MKYFENGCTLAYLALNDTVTGFEFGTSFFLNINKTSSCCLSCVRHRSVRKRMPLQRSVAVYFEYGKKKVCRNSNFKIKISKNYFHISFLSSLLLSIKYLHINSNYSTEKFKFKFSPNIYV